MKVTFILLGRSGNNIFQYCMCKLFTIKYGHVYQPYKYLTDSEKQNSIEVTDANASEILGQCNNSIYSANIICNGYFQQSDYYISYREQLMEIIYNNNMDYWYCDNHVQYVNMVFNSKHSIPDLTVDDIVMSLRLDDFIQLPDPVSDIIPPSYYLNIIESRNFNRLIIVCDTIRHDWERKYLEFFNKWSPTLIQKDIYHDCALYREAPYLIHSNSTLSWIMSFFSKIPKIRYIPKTYHYRGQSLNCIDIEDVLCDVKTLTHNEVYTLDYKFTKLRNIYPLSYSIPDECIVDSIPEKFNTIAKLIPGDISTYSFTFSQEREYNEMYRQSRFAYTQKKGGWDALRHYEILANGCIPIFKDLDILPKHSMTSFPKNLILAANNELLPWQDTTASSASSHDTIQTYNKYVDLLLCHMRKHCSTSSAAKYILETTNNMHCKNILLIKGHSGINYTREFSWIGLKRYIQSISGIAVEYPKISVLYEPIDTSESAKKYHGNGFTYSNRLKDDYNYTHDQIINGIQNKFWDLIIYGKVGPDELFEGSHPNMPLWEHVFKRYSKNEIIFLYGGDECIDLTTKNRYSDHILHHSQFAHCFVRELNI